MNNYSIESKNPIKIDNIVIEKIQYLCRISPDKEWSGILLWESDMKDFPNMNIVLKDIIIMNIGSAASTEFKYNDNGQDFYIDYIMNNPDAKKYRIGQIHSHCNMKVFFSSVDLSDMTDTVESRDFYLSVVVNNGGEFTAKLATACVTNFSLVHLKEQIYDTTNDKDCLFVDIPVSLVEDRKIKDDFFLDCLKQIKEKNEKKYTHPYGYNQPLVDRKPYQQNYLFPESECYNKYYDKNVDVDKIDYDQNVESEFELEEEKEDISDIVDRAINNTYDESRKILVNIFDKTSIKCMIESGRSRDRLWGYIMTLVSGELKESDVIKIGNVMKKNINKPQDYLALEDLYYILSEVEEFSPKIINNLLMKIEEIDK